MQTDAPYIVMRIRSRTALRHVCALNGTSPSRCRIFVTKKLGLLHKYSIYSEISFALKSEALIFGECVHPCILREGSSEMASTRFTMFRESGRMAVIFRPLIQWREAALRSGLKHNARQRVCPFTMDPVKHMRGVMQGSGRWGGGQQQYG
eukprot:IDg16442t1